MVKICPRSAAHLILLPCALAAGCVADEEPDPVAAEAVGLGIPAEIDPPTPETAPPLITIDPRRSLAVTELPILERFTFRRVMEQLVAQSGVEGLTALGLFHQWWDTQNQTPGVLPGGPHCGDTVDDLGQPAINGFPYTCRPAPAEGAQATTDPFVDPGVNPDEYIPIGLFNRFDLAPSDASNCGEYRIVFAKRSGITFSRQRNLVIFEMALANPHPQQGLKGCRKIVDWWADLTSEPDLADRADKLEQLYFTGIPGVPPVVHVDHLGSGPTGAGQVRTNQFMQEGLDPRFWSLREFKLIRTCADDVCTSMQLVPVTVKNNPFGGLFRADSTHPSTAAFRAAFVEQVAALAAPTLAEIDFQIDDAFDTAQAQASGTENNYVAHFGTDPNPLRDAIALELAEIGSVLTPDEVVARAQSLSCAGCHRLSNNLALGSGLVFPTSIGFVHVSEREMEVVDGVTRFQLSQALVDEFLPKRKQVMEDYLNDKLVHPPRPKDPIGGRRTH